MDSWNAISLIHLVLHIIQKLQVLTFSEYASILFYSGFDFIINRVWYA